MCDYSQNKVNKGKSHHQGECLFIIYTLSLLYPFAIKGALYLSIKPSILHLIFKTHLFPMVLPLSERSYNS